MTIFRRRFEKSWLIRLLLLGVTTVVGITAYGVADYVTARAEYRQHEHIVDSIRTHPDAIELRGDALPQGMTRFGPDVIRIVPRWHALVNIYVAFVDIKCGKPLMAAARSDGKLLNWQWDYRILQSGKRGQNWFVLSVPRSMGRNKPYNFVFHIDESCHKVRRLFLIPVNSKKQWERLFYMDVFYRDGERYETLRPTYYQVNTRPWKKEETLIRQLVALSGAPVP